MQNFIYELSSMFSSRLVSIIEAALLLILAFIVAAVVRNLILKLVKKTKFFAPKEGEQAGSKNSALKFIGQLIYLFVFLLFVPSIFSLLRIDSISSPIQLLLNTVWGYLPNILACVIVLVVGLLIAKTVRQLLIPVFDKLKVNDFQKKIGIEGKGSSLSSTLAYVVYVLILIPICITALQALDIRAISEPTVNMLYQICSFLPNIFVALIIILIGCVIAKMTGQLVTRLIGSAGLDAKLTAVLDPKFASFSLSKVTGVLVHAIIIIFFVTEGLNILQLNVLTHIGNAVISYLPQVLSAILILIIGFILAGIAQKTLSGGCAAAHTTAIKAAIYVLSVFLALNQLGIATELVNAAFILILAAVAVAFAIAFGIGGKDAAASVLKKLDCKCDKEDCCSEDKSEES